MKRLAFIFVLLCMLPFYISGQTDTEVYKQNARQLRKEGKLAEAVKELSRAIDAAPNDARLYIERAQIYLQTKNTDAMEQDLSKAVGLEPANESIILSAAHVMFNAHSYGREFCSLAVSMLDPFLLNNPNADRVFQLRAVVKQCAGDFFGAFQDYSKAAEIQPDNQLYKADVARSLSNIGDSPQALELLNKFIAENEAKLSATEDQNKKSELQFTISRLYYSRSTIFEKQGNIEAMFTDLDKMVKLLPHGLSYYSRAMAYTKHKKYPEAINDLSEVIKLQPKQSFNYLRRGDLFYGTGKLSEALNDYEKALSLNENAQIAPTIEKRIKETKEKLGQK